MLSVLFEFLTKYFHYKNFSSTPYFCFSFSSNFLVFFVFFSIWYLKVLIEIRTCRHLRSPGNYTAFSRQRCICLTPQPLNIRMNEFKKLKFRSLFHINWISFIWDVYYLSLSDSKILKKNDYMDIWMCFQI